MSLEFTVCPQCGRIIRARGSQGRRRKFCSAECGSRYRWRLRRYPAGVRS